MTFDVPLFYFFNSIAGRSPILDGAIVFCASYLAYILVVLFLALVLFSAYSKREKWEILFVTALSSVIARFGVTELIRFFSYRPRPFAELSVNQLISHTASSSFPSGHATFFFAMATALYLYNKKWGTWFFVAAIVITVSRVIAGVHYPSDIIGGALIGVLVGYVTIAVVRRIGAARTEKTDIATY